MKYSSGSYKVGGTGGFILLLVAFWTLGLAGCGSGDGLNRKALSGKVTSDGRPIPNGSISFEPLQAGGISSGGTITSGAYKVEQKDGLPPGKYRVTMTGDDGSNFAVSAGKMPGDEIMPARKSFVPEGWSQEIEVKDSSNTFDFQVSMKK